MSQHILIVEDDEMIQAFLKLHLENEGYRVSCAGTGAAMYTVLAADEVSLILLDLGLPDGDGLSLAQKVREQSTVPIIVLTARKSADDRLLALGLGADDYLTKPIDPKELSLRIRNVLNRSSDNTEFVSPTRVVAPQPYPQQVTPKRRMGAVYWGAIVLLIGAGAFWAFDFGSQNRTAVPVSPKPAPQIAKAPKPSPAPALQPAPLVEKKTAPAALPRPAAPPAEPEEETIRSKAEILGYGWVLNSKCGRIPEVEWWQFRTHEAIANYVMRKHSGDWKPYLKTWIKRLVKLQDIAERNSSAVTRTGVVLKDKKLATYIAQTSRRIGVVRCLAAEAKAAGAG
jgi:CheY-like chemotaxis protein